MRTSIKAALVAFSALGALAATGASAQPYYGPHSYGTPNYDDSYYGSPYSNGYYDQDDQYADAYGPSCDPYYGCPDDYYNDPYFDGELFYDGAWLNGPFFYRNYGGGRQYWIHGGWHNAQGRGGNYRQALGRDWYQNHSGGNRGFANRGNFGNRSYGNYRDYNQRSGNSSFQSQRSFQAQPQQNFGSSGNDWRSRYSNRQGFGGNSFQPQQAQPQQSFSAPTTRGNFWQRGGGNGGGWQGRGDGGRSFQQQAAPAAQAQPQPQGSGHSWGGRGDGGGSRGDGDHGGHGDGGWRR